MISPARPNRAENEHGYPSCHSSFKMESKSEGKKRLKIWSAQRVRTKSYLNGRSEHRMGQRSQSAKDYHHQESVQE